ncbi:MAG TPA: proline--tRNA ligase [Candidatus Baltobacteraceae bacterium]|nr:proline--tRNA ligase [Candidatus Baltobacteraceae bacterium]
MEEKKGITVKKAENFSEWYTQAILKAEFADYTSVSGAMALRPDSYFVWESIQKAVDPRLKEMGVQNTAFPLLIPEKLLSKFAAHIGGFSPEVAWVTRAGSTDLEERLAIRPTSEAIMYDSYAKWIRSWRDLPMKLNQWNSVVRWEFKHPMPFIRTREHFWHEGHTVFATEQEARAERDVILDMYITILRDYLALPGIAGRKTEAEKFAGGEESYSIEHLMPDGRAVQGPAFHFDGQNFSKAFEISFLNKEEKKEYAWQNTYAISTRDVGVMIATHGDDKGLVIPPLVARIQIVIVPITKTENREKVVAEAVKLKNTLSKNFRVHLDDDDSTSPGWKYNHWEMRGVPMRIEIGERDIAANSVVVVRRDTAEKASVAMDGLEQKITGLVQQIQSDLYEKAERFLKANIHKAEGFDEMKEILETKRGIVEAGWCGSEECEEKIKAEGAKITNMPFDKQSEAKSMVCIVCGNHAKHVANVAKSI